MRTSTFIFSFLFLTNSAFGQSAEMHRAAVIEDGTNEVLALGGAGRLLSAKVRGEN